MKQTREEKDRATLEAIGRIYCKAHHSPAENEKDSAGLCAWCRAAIDATLQRAQACPYGHTGNCQDCKTQCQQGQAKRDIKTIMRFAAPRMAFRHPLMTLEYVRKKHS